MRCQDTCYHKSALQLENIDEELVDEITEISDIDFSDQTSVHYQMVQVAYFVADLFYSFTGTPD